MTSACLTIPSCPWVCLSAEATAAVSTTIPGIVSQPIHTIVAYGGSSASGPGANTLCTSLTDFKNSTKPGASCPTNVPIPPESFITYRVIWDSPYSSQPDGFRLALFPPYPVIPTGPPSVSSIVIKSSGDYGTTSSLPPLGECWTGPTDTYTLYFKDEANAGNPPVVTTSVIGGTPSKNQIEVSQRLAGIAVSNSRPMTLRRLISCDQVKYEPSVGGVPPTETRRVDLICTLQTKDVQLQNTGGAPLTSQWNWYSLNDTRSGCKTLQVGRSRGGGMVVISGEAGIQAHSDACDIIKYIYMCAYYMRLMTRNLFVLLVSPLLTTHEIPQTYAAYTSAAPVIKLRKFVMGVQPGPMSNETGASTTYDPKTVSSSVCTSFTNGVCGGVNAYSDGG
jgi:hypothetical protein